MRNGKRGFKGGCGLLLKALSKNLSLRHASPGFGLMEMVIAMAIMAVITAVSLPKVYEQYESKYIEKTAIEVHYITEAAKNYYRTIKSWPADIQALEDTGYLPLGWDPKNPWGNVYTVADNGTSFTVSTDMPGKYKNALGMYLPNVTVAGNTASSTTPIPGSEASLQGAHDGLLPIDGSRSMTGDLLIEKNTPAMKLIDTVTNLAMQVRNLAGNLVFTRNDGADVVSIDQSGNLSVTGSGRLKLGDGNTALWQGSAGVLNIASPGISISSGAVTTNLIVEDNYFQIDTSAVNGVLFPKSVSLGTNALFNLGSMTADPPAANGSMYYNTLTQRFRCYENGTWMNCVGGESAQARWSGLQNPNSNTALNMGSYTSTFTWGPTGPGVNAFTITDTDNNPGSGALMNIATGLGSAMSPLRVRAGATDAIAVTNAARVGIGKLNPQAKLDVYGNVIVGDGGTGVGLTVNAQSILLNQSYSSLQFGSDSEKIVGAQNQYLAFYSMNQEIMRLTQSGVGIGTSTPQAAFEVASNPGVYGQIIARGEMGSGISILGPEDEDGLAQGWTFTRDLSGSLMIRDAYWMFPAMAFGPFPLYNIGIGSDPSENAGDKLTVAGNIRVTGKLISDISEGEPPLEVGSRTMVPNLNVELLGGHQASEFVQRGNVTGTQNYLVKYTGTSTLGTSIFYENPDTQRIGIGTTSPGAKLDIWGGIKWGAASTGMTGSGQLMGSAGSPIASRLVFGTDNTGWQFSIAKNVAGTITDLMRVADTGKVSIGGIATAGDTLEVRGVIRASSSGTDYARLANNYLKAYTSGAFTFDAMTVGQGFQFRTGNSAALDTTPLTISADGKLGVNSGSPGVALDVRHQTIDLIGWGVPARMIGRLTYTDTNTAVLSGMGGVRLMLAANEDTTGHMIIGTDGAIGMGAAPNSSYRLYVAGNAYATGTWGTSDIRFKKDIRAIPNPLEKVLALEGIGFTWRRDEFPGRGFDSGRQIGVIAQDVEKILPELVMTSADGYKSVNYPSMAGLFIEAIKELNSRVARVSGAMAIVKTEVNMNGRQVTRYEMRDIETLQKLVSYSAERAGDRDVTGYVSARDFYIADRNRWVSEAGPRFIDPVLLFQGKGNGEFKRIDLAGVVRERITAVILEIDQDKDAYIEARQCDGLPVYRTVRGQNVFPVSGKQTIDLAVTGEGPVAVRLVGYY